VNHYISNWGHRKTSFDTLNNRSLVEKQIDPINEMKKTMFKYMAITDSKTKSRGYEILEDGFILMYSGVPKIQKPKQEYDA
jgi:hypothetical protein